MIANRDATLHGKVIVVLATCCEALAFYGNSLKLISTFANYKPVYECDCGFYGIELHSEEVKEAG